MWDDSTKKIKDLEIGDEVWTINASHPNFGGSHIEHNKGEKGILWRKDYKGTIPQNLVKITLPVLKERIFNIKKGIIQSSPFIIGFGKIN